MTEQEIIAPAAPEPIAEAPAEAPIVDESPTPPDPEPSTRRESIEKAFSALESDESPAQEGQPRGPDGKFTAKEPAAATEAPADRQDEEKPVEAPATDDAAPARFSADAKAAWKDASPAIKGEVTRAIRELEGGIAQKDQQLAPLKPYFEMAQQHGTTVDNALANYVGMEQLLRRDLRGGLNQLAQNFGMTFDDMIAKATGGQPASTNEAQEIVALKNQVAQLTQQISGVSTNVQETHEQNMMREIEAFAADKPRFDELSPDISKLLANGMAETLDAAYEMAERLNPAPVAPTPEPLPATPAQTRQPRSVTGAPSAGSNPDVRKPSKSRTEALQRAFQGAGLT